MKKWTATKTMEISAAHKLTLPYDSPCSNLHGHNWVISVTVESNELTNYGMVMDFKWIKNVVSDKLDHQCINDVLGDINPTAENMASWIMDEINRVAPSGRCIKVVVQESEGNVGTCEEN